MTIGCDDPDALVGGVHGIEIERQTTNAGQRMALLHDPDGNLVVFVEALSGTDDPVPRVSSD